MDRSVEQCKNGEMLMELFIFFSPCDVYLGFSSL